MSSSICKTAKSEQLPSLLHTSDKVYDGKFITLQHLSHRGEGKENAAIEAGAATMVVSTVQLQASVGSVLTLNSPMT